MRSDAWRIASHRGTVSIHAHDNAAPADRVSETRIEVHASRRRKDATGRHGFAPQAGIRSARVSRVIDFMVDRPLRRTMLNKCGFAAQINIDQGTARSTNKR